jgi:hypothetical protein
MRYWAVMITTRHPHMENTMSGGEVEVVLRDGIEPPTRGFSVRCIADWLQQLART